MSAAARGRACVALGILLAAASLAPSEARADERAIAQQAFSEGKRLMAEGRYADACPKLAAAAQLSPTPGVRINLADCYVKLGKLASAWAKADEAATMAARAGDTAAVEAARARMAAIEPRVSHLALKVADPAIELKVDGDRLPAAVWGTPIPVDTGDHLVEATQPGRARFTTTAHVTAEHQTVTVEVPALAPEAAPVATPMPVPSPAASAARPAAAAPAPPAPAAPPPATAAPSSTRATAGLVTGAVGVVALGVGTFTAMQALSKKSLYQDHTDAAGNCLDDTCASASKDAVSAAKLSTVFFVAGGALAATGVVVWLTAPSGKDARRIGVVPALGNGGAGAVLTGDL